MSELSTRERRMLAFERHWFLNARAKESTITEQFGMSATRYFQILNHLLDDPRAMRHDPQTVARLRRLRVIRQHARHETSDVLRNRRQRRAF